MLSITLLGPFTASGVEHTFLSTILPETKNTNYNFESYEVLTYGINSFMPYVSLLTKNMSKRPQINIYILLQNLNSICNGQLQKKLKKGNDKYETYILNTCQSKILYYLHNCFLAFGS